MAESSDSLPFPPLELANRVLSLEGRGDPLEVYERLGLDTKAAILRLLPADWSFEGKRALDFGCGAGRTLRHFLDEAEASGFWGVDIDAPSIDWLRESLCPPLHAIVGSEAPPLAFESASFDLIWALSVFTHLTEQSAPWLVELHRLLRPGGFLIATYMGRWNSETLAKEPWDEDRIGMNVLRPNHSWDHGGPAVLMSDWWVSEHWGRAFEFIASEPNVHNQTWVLLRKREVEINAIELLAPGPDPREFAALRHNIVQLTREEAELIANHRRILERPPPPGRLRRGRTRIKRLSTIFRTRGAS